MYVSPFWSYRWTGAGLLLKNWLSRECFIAPGPTIDVLEALTQGCSVDSSTENLLNLLRDRGILFQTVSDAERAFQRFREPRDASVPRVEQIELTNRCPYRCRMCPRTTEMMRALGDMPLSLFERIIHQLGGHQDYVALHHFGESLTHPGLPEAVRLASQRGLRTGLSCNPPSLRPQLAAALLASGLSNVLLSLDSLDAATYAAIRGKAARLDLADRHIRELVRLRDEGGYDAFITLQMISMRRNAGESERFLEYCKSVGVDRGLVVRLGRWDFDDQTLGELGEFSTPGYTGFCVRPSTSIVVLWDGRVVPCCHDYDGQVVLGNLSSQSLSEVWNSEDARSFRDNSESSSLCRSCAFSQWFRERQRQKEGFRAFHKERGLSKMEWLRLDQQRTDGRVFFDEFDIAGNDV